MLFDKHSIRMLEIASIVIFVLGFLSLMNAAWGHYLISLLTALAFISSVTLILAGRKKYKTLLWILDIGAVIAFLIYAIW